MTNQISSAVAAILASTTDAVMSVHAELVREIEGYDCNDDGTCWGVVYLDNLSTGGRRLSGLLSNLEKIGLYKPDGDGFGLVRFE